MQPRAGCAPDDGPRYVPGTASTLAELKRKLAEHLAAAHNVHPPTKTVMSYLETKIRYEGPAGRLWQAASHPHRPGPDRCPPWP